MVIDGQVREYLNHLKVERNLSANTIAAYKRDLERYVAFLHDNATFDVAQVSEDLIEKYQSFISHSDFKYAATSIARMLASVRGFHAFALKERWIKIDVTQSFASVRPSMHLPKALSVNETVALVESLSASEELLDIRDYALLEFLYSTGARISEAINIELQDIDRAEMSVKLTGKGDKTRIVPLGSKAIEALDKYVVRVRPSLMKKTSQFVFLNRSGGQMSRQSAFNAISVAAKNAKIDVKVSPHTLRHCYATHLLEGGADVRIVQELLGHASVTTTQIYTLVTAQRLREIYSTSHPRSR